MSDLPIFISVSTSVIGVLGYFIRRAILVHDKNETRTQEMIVHNGLAAEGAISKAEQAVMEAKRAANDTQDSALKVQETLEFILSELKGLNHRTVKLEAMDAARREIHQQRGG